MMFTRNQRAPLKLLVVFYFLAYAVSPLTCGILAQPVRAGAMAVSVAGSSFVARENPGDQGRTSFLFKQKRAVVPEGASVELSDLKHASARINDPAQLPPATCSSSVLPADITGCYNGFNPVFSGHSPPAA